MSDVSEVDVIKAVACDIPLGDSFLDAYMMPSGDKRFGIEGIGIALGYTDRWFYNRTKRQSKWLRCLHNTGFTGAQLELRVIRQFEGKTYRGASVAKTIK